MAVRLLERSNSMHKAQQSWADVVKKYSIKSLKRDYTYNGFSTRLCYLTTPRHLTVRGAGKGANIFEIDASASYEAIEFYFSSYHSHHYPLVHGSLSDIASQYPTLLQRCDSHIFMEEAHKKPLSIPWLIYKNAVTEQQYAVPLATVDLNYFTLSTTDTFNYSVCKAYSSSNGLSSGSSYEESIIHGSLELLERDAYSYFLVDTFVLNKKIQIIDNRTLPENCLLLIAKIEKNLNNSVVILKMPSRFGVHCFLATFAHSEFSIKPRGSGASLSATYALERAVHELVQSYLLMHGNYFDNAIDLQRLENNLLIKDFLSFKLLNIKEDHFSLINFQEDQKQIAQLNLSEYLTQLISLIEAQSTSLLINVMYRDENGLTCSSVKIPEIEELCLATYYLRAVPTLRMQNYITEALGKKFNWEDYKIHQDGNYLYA